MISQNWIELLCWFISSLWDVGDEFLFEPNGLNQGGTYFDRFRFSSRY
jgi:hypothetical protein